MLANEIRYLDTDFRRSIVTSDPARFAKRVADGTYHFLFEVMGFVDFIQWFYRHRRHMSAGSDPSCTIFTI